jgi:pilus assembly protein Flp/PilA
MEHTENKEIVVVEKKSRLQELVEDTRGANLVEYIILVGVVALIALAGYKVFGTSVTAKINQQAGGVNSINGAAAY